MSRVVGRCCPCYPVCLCGFKESVHPKEWSVRAKQPCSELQVHVAIFRKAPPRAILNVCCRCKKIQAYRGGAVHEEHMTDAACDAPRIRRKAPHVTSMCRALAPHVQGCLRFASTRGWQHHEESQEAKQFLNLVDSTGRETLVYVNTLTRDVPSAQSVLRGCTSRRMREGS